MDEDFMAPPFKRRKLSSSMPHSPSYQDNSTAPSEALPSFAHAVESLYEYSSLASTRTTPQTTEDAQTPLPRPAYGGTEDFKVLVPRQGTLAVSIVVDSPTSSAVTPSTSASSTESTSSSSSTVTSPSTTSTSVRAYTVSGEISTDATTSTTDATTSTTNATTSTTDATTSTADATTSTTDATTSATDATTSTPTSIPTNYSSNASSSVASSAISSSHSNATSVTYSDSLSTSTSISSSSLNLTTSAITLKSESVTTTSKTTITLGASSSSSTDSAFFYFLATLSNGDVSTISESNHAYTTTLSDGEVFTVPSASSRTTQRTSSSADHQTSTVLQTTSLIRTSAGKTTVTSVATVSIAGGATGGSPGYNTPVSSSAPSSTGSASSGYGSNNNNNTPPAGTIAGGVVGGAAGLAVVVLIAMLFVRWYRRKAQMGHRALPAGSATSPETDPTVDSHSQGPGMAERAGIMPFVAAVPALFRHHNRSAEGSEPTERGFTRVSGRKLPSAFSDGMNSAQPPPPRMPLSNSPSDERDLSSRSSQRDSHGFYGGEGRPASDRSGTSPSSLAPIRTSGPEMMTMSPGPQRQPQLHTGGPYVMSPTSSDATTSPPGTAATFGRSDTPSSLRNSRFTEDM